MSAVDPHAPCIVGVAQLVVRPGEDPIEPLEMWERVARSAADDASPSAPARVLDALDRLHVVFCQTWDYDDPAGRLAGRLGIAPRDRRYSGIGGTVPQVLVADAAAAIGRGELSSALVCMGEGGAAMRAAMKAGGPPRWSHRAPVPTRFPFEAPTHPAEKAHGVQQAWLTFAMRDVARRAARGDSPESYRADLSETMSALTRVAATNPYAWFPIERTASDLGDARADNRYIGYPYTKLLCSFLDVDQAAAVIVMSHAEADRLGVAPDRRVYLHTTAYDEDAVYVAEHPDLGRSPAMAKAAHGALSAAGIGVDDVAHFDLYSCFPASLGFAQDALGLAHDDARPLTVTGGLPYSGGPGSGYMVASIAAMAATLRSDPGSYGVVSGVGMHMTKHVYGVYSTEPPAPGSAPGFSYDDPIPPEVRPIVSGPDADGGATVAAYSVVHGRDGSPGHAVVIADVGGSDEGARAYAIVTDADWLAAAETEELVGTAVELRADPRGFTVAYGAG